MIKNISNLGDAALYCDFGSEVNQEINSKVIRYFKSIQKENICLLYTSPSPRDMRRSRMPSSA